MLCPTADEAAYALLSEPDRGSNGLAYARPTISRAWSGRFFRNLPTFDPPAPPIASLVTFGIRGSLIHISVKHSMLYLEA
jgi:hypothetical protein